MATKEIRPGMLFEIIQDVVYFTDLKQKPRAYPMRKNTIVLFLKEERKDDTNYYFQSFLDLDGNVLCSHSSFSMENKIKARWLKSI